MAMLRSSVGLALRRSASDSATSGFRSNRTANLTLRRLAPAAAASRFGIGGCGSPRSIHTEQDVAKNIEKSKQRLLNLYMNSWTDKNHKLNVKSLEEELDYLIRHIQNKATECAKTKRLFEQMDSEEKYFHFLDNVLAPAAVTLMFAWWMWTIGST